jgi:hypothetical protein
MTASITPYIIGLEWHIDDAGLISIEEASARVGGNTGNLAFSYAISRHLGLTKQLPTSWSGLPSEIRHSQSHAGVFAMANVLGSHVNLSNLASEYEDLAHSLSIIGIGAQSAIGAESVEIPKGTLSFLNIVAEKSLKSRPNIAVRGDFTLKVLTDYGLGQHCVSLGCPSLFINPSRKLGESISAASYNKNITTLAVCAAHYKWGHLRRVEKDLVRLVDVHNGIYIVQSPLEMLRLASNELEQVDASILECCRSMIHEDLSITGFIHWLRTHATSYYSAAEWMSSVRQYQFVVGFRIHGVMLALQAGIPAICLVHDSRTLELCEKMMVPYIKHNDIPECLTLSSLINEFHKQFNPTQFDENRLDLLQAYLSFYSNNGLRAASYLHEMNN